MTRRRPEGLQCDAHNEMIRPGGHNLIDGATRSVAHGLHMFHESLFGIERTLFNGGARGVISHATWAQHVAFWLNGRVSGGNDETDLLRKPRVSGMAAPNFDADRTMNVMEFVRPLY